MNQSRLNPKWIPQLEEYGIDMSECDFCGAMEPSHVLMGAMSGDKKPACQKCRDDIKRLPALEQNLIIAIKVIE